MTRFGDLEDLHRHAETDLCVKKKLQSGTRHPIQAPAPIFTNQVDDAGALCLFFVIDERSRYNSWTKAPIRFWAQPLVPQWAVSFKPARTFRHLDSLSMN